MTTAEPSALFKPVRRRSFEEVASQIRAQITSGALREGDKLPPERALAEVMGVSRNTVREALRALEYAGLLQLKPGIAGGATITNGSVETIRDAFSDLISLGTLSVQQLIEARIVIGTEVARLACARYTPEDLQALERNVELTRQAAQAGDLKLRVRHSVAFHPLLAAAARNPVLSIMTSVLVEITINVVRALGEMPNEFVIESRDRMMAHLRARDAEAAAQEYRDYLHKALHYLRDAELGAGGRFAVPGLSLRR